MLIFFAIFLPIPTKLLTLPATIMRKCRRNSVATRGIMQKQEKYLSQVAIGFAS